MFRIDGPSRAAALPAPAAAGTGASSPGYFTRGDPSSGVPPTTIDADWMNMVQEELMAPVLAAGLSPSKTNRSQLLAAMQAMFVPVGAQTGASYSAGQGTIPLPDGFLLKFGTQSGSFVEQQLAVNFTTAFPNGCLIVVPVALNATAGNTRDVWAQIVSKSAGGFVAMLQKSGGSGNTDANDGIDWIALGN